MRRRFPDRRGFLPVIGPASPVPVKVIAANVEGGGTSFDVTICACRSAANIDLAADANTLAQISLSAYTPTDATAGTTTLCASIAAAADNAGMPCAVLSFPVHVDTSRPWSVRIPSRSGLIRSRFGGFMAGVIGPDEDISTTPDGSIYMSPTDGGVAPMIPLAWLLSGGPSSGSNWAFWFADASGSIDWTIQPGGIHLVGTGGPIVCPAVPLLGGGVEIDLSGVPTSYGDWIECRPWNPSARGDGGEFMGPWRFTF